MTPLSWKNLFLSLWQKKLARLSLVLLALLALLALNASWIANSTPLYASYQDKTYFPVLREIWPIKHLELYPELQGIDWQQSNTKKILRAPIPYSPDDYDLDAILEAPSLKHPLGTDEQGRDVLSRMIHGSQVSLSVGLIAVGIYVALGLFLGALAGYFGGRADFLLSRFIEIIICFPTFFLILTLVAVLGRSLVYIMIAIGLTGWTGIARLVRGEFLKLKNQDFINAARTLGLSNRRIIFYHLLPNSLAPILVSATFGMASSILIESSLSFLGFGVPPPTPSWGHLLSSSRGFMDMAWWLTLFPGLAIFLSITTLNLLGESLRDILDPKLKGL